MVVCRDPNLYFVDLNGGAPERFPIDRGSRCSFSSDGKSMLYTRKGDEDYYWKRYKGGQYQDIWKFSFETKQFTPVTDYVGKNSYPMWIGDKMYLRVRPGQRALQSLGHGPDQPQGYASSPPSPTSM